MVHVWTRPLGNALKRKLLVIHQDVLSPAAGNEKSCGGVPPFLIARLTPDCRNLYLSTAERRPRRSVDFVGVPSSRATRSKCFDFTLDLSSYEVRSFSERFTCNQVLLVEDRRLYGEIVGLADPPMDGMKPPAEPAIDYGAAGDSANGASSCAGHSAGVAAAPARPAARYESSTAPDGTTMSYLEHHAALVKLALTFRNFSLGKELAVLLLLDTLLGIWLGPVLCSWWPMTLESAVARVRRVVAWLRAGTPLGLKLNPQVNQALAKFFTCHVNMWHVYVDVLLPSLRALTDAVAAHPYVPLSIQCSLVCDITTLTTVHVYCFYGYMCKLYSVWLSALFALLRIFRGLKWNPLRQRVDSLADSDPVLLGPIILTILVFLSPTVFLYYVVFSIMRCCVLVVNFSLGTVVHDVQVLVFDVLKSLASKPVIQLRKTRVVRINEFALKAEARYSRNTGKLLVDGFQRLIRLRELLTFCRDLCVGKIVYPL
ncbi:hypothetical protein BIW11_08909 [Tropilaelaps mercedesae]|uniref:Phosphatidylinositol N-acetylglucosaminyltransferase subunit Q-like n=1 Tax=Tropilaelaps mercedesae TaxID=418985 RepID=A0A1V9XME0_9ACAR|nr:hypothetical protein BIW11_08909 [Tropilaelaps mercedesae]